MGRGVVALGAAVALAILGACRAEADAAENPLAADNPISAENRLPGDSGWRLRRPAAPGQLEGYPSLPSVNHGEALTIHARADGSHTLTWLVYRMGWYGGAEGRLVASGGRVPVGPRTVPAPDPLTGLLACDWPATFTVQTGPDWTTGIHLVRLVRDDGVDTWVPFVVRDDARKGAAVVQQAVTTYQAYNPWGGKSLYTVGGREVSFDRPFAEGNGSGQYFRYEHEFVKWAESRGFDLVYLTSVDLERDPSLLLGQRLFLSVGHDEYWSAGMRAALEAALAAGVSFASLGANELYWQIRLEPSRTTGAPRRTQVCWKKDAPTLDPLRGTARETSQFRDVGAPENALVGVMYSAWVLADAPWIVRNASAWPYQGTGVADGDALPLLVGYETDRTFDNGATPEGTVVLAHSPVTSVEGHPDVHEAAVHDTPAGGFVFAAGTIQWPWGLGRPGVADERVRRITENVLRRAGLVPLSPATAAPPLPASGETLVVVPRSPVVIAGSPGDEGLRDGSAAEARFRRPTGAALDAAGRLWVADTGNHAVRVVAPDGGHAVVTVAGDGQPGGGDGAAARLRWPQAIAFAPDGTPYVADSGNHRIVRLRPGSGDRWIVETVAGLDGWPAAVDGQGTDARFWDPAGLAFVGEDLYVADRGNGRIRRIDRGGNVTTVAGAAGKGFADGPGAAAAFRFPSDLAVFGGQLAVLDAGNRAIRTMGLAPPYPVATLAGGTPGFGDGPAESARFMPLAGIAAADGALLVADGGNARVRELRDGTVRTWAGAGGDPTIPRLAAPTAVVQVADGWIVVDQGSSTLRVVGSWGGTASGSPPPAGGPPPGGDPSPSGARNQGGCATGADAGLAALAALAAARLLRRRAPIHVR